MALLQWRKPAAGELDHEGLWLAVGAGAAGMFATGARLGLPMPRCLFHALTGYPCPGCGSTRALRQLLAGHLSTALWFNPLMTVVACAGAAWSLYAACVLVSGGPRLRVGEVPPAGARAVRLGVVAALLANWGWVIAHGM